MVFVWYRWWLNIDNKKVWAVVFFQPVHVHVFICICLHICIYHCLSLYIMYSSEMISKRFSRRWLTCGFLEPCFNIPNGTFHPTGLYPALKGLIRQRIYGWTGTELMFLFLLGKDIQTKTLAIVEKSIWNPFIADKILPFMVNKILPRIRRMTLGRAYCGSVEKWKRVMPWPRCWRQRLYKTWS